MQKQVIDGFMFTAQQERDLVRKEIRRLWQERYEMELCPPTPYRFKQIGAMLEREIELTNWLFHGHRSTNK